MTIPSVDNTTLLNLVPNLDIGDIADPALRLAAFQYIYTEMQAIVSEVNSIPTANLQNLSVITTKINDLAVITGKIADLAVTTAKLNDLSVTLSKMAANSVGTTQLVDGAVTTSKHADGSVTLLKLDPALVTSDISLNMHRLIAILDHPDGSVVDAKLGNNPTDIKARFNVLQSDVTLSNTRRKELAYNVKDYGASGSIQATTGSIAVGTNILTLAAAIDFLNGQGIFVAGNIEVANFVVTAGASSSANCTVTLNGVAKTVALTSGNTATQVATAIRATSYSGWTTGGSGTTVTFTSTTAGTRTDATYSAGTTGATGTMTTTTQGSANLITTVTNGAGTTTLTLAANATATVSGLVVTHDESIVIQALVNLIAPVGGTIFFPAGTYKVATKIDVDLSGDAPQASGKGINIRGDNMNTTILLNATVNDYVMFIHSSGPTEAGNAHFLMEHFTVGSAGGSLTGGIKMSGFSQSSIQNVFFFQQGQKSGLYLEDIVTCNLYNCRFNQNTYGLTAIGQVTFSTPNAIDLHSCVFYGNGVYGAYFNGGCNLNFFGGTVETNGFDTSVGLRWGVKMDGFGQYGAAGATFTGTYFEGNQNVADVWINHTNYAATYTFVGCTFNRFASPQFSDHNIRVDAGSTTALTVACLVNTIGCAFRNFGGYVISSARPYIQFYTGGTPCTWEQSGNFYNDVIEEPTLPSNRVFATGRFIGLGGTPGIYRAFNIASVVKNATGDYTITFIKPAVSAAHISTFGMDIKGFYTIIAETATTIRVNVFNASSVATDPSQLSMIVME